MPDAIEALRRSYIHSLQQLAENLQSPRTHLVADSRRQLAHLRHSLRGGRQHHAYEVVFRRPPGQSGSEGSDWLPRSEHEQDVWLLIGGLFALHPQPWRRGNGPRSLGASMGLLDKMSIASASRRFTELLGRDRATLPHHLRQAIQLLSRHDIAVHYGQLLDDLVVLLGRAYAGEQAAGVRLRWAREFHMPATAELADAEPVTAEATHEPNETPTDLEATQ